ncbi:MAG: glycosyltransferase family 2 protein [Gammaproteobacteria bacterium]|nr:glycosyltransferase family 2 protein [Gammaproteobacteria bacterium]
MNKEIILSLIIPCYNEAGNLKNLVNRCIETITRDDVEVILVDNGSTDLTPDIIHDLLVGHGNLRTVRVDENKGYGYGIVYGLKNAKGKFLSWTHADLQADPADILEGLTIIEEHAYSDNIYIKGKRYGRSFHDLVFTWGMALFESVILNTAMWDVNAQPTIFSKTFFSQLNEPPSDFSLDLYTYYMAKKTGLSVYRYPVYFGKRFSGNGHNDKLIAKIKYSYKTIIYSLSLRNKLFG